MLARGALLNVVICHGTNLLQFHSEEEQLCVPNVYFHSGDCVTTTAQDEQYQELHCGSGEGVQTLGAVDCTTCGPLDLTNTVLQPRPNNGVHEMIKLFPSSLADRVLRGIYA